ncbi:MAG TPA: acyl-CoA reductase [Arenibacter sp.]|nr:acyl-CoA reductase [Arenibacter sp.]
MTELASRINAFVKLGSFFKEYCEYVKKKPSIDPKHYPWFIKLDETVALAEQQNGWFTPDNIFHGLENWAELLTPTNLNDWLSAYDLRTNRPKSVAVIMAGNIPLVGFHDFLCIVLTGNKVRVKLSSNDRVLLPFVAQYLIEIEPSFKGDIEFVEGKLDDFDAVIATGSDNTSRYFEHYFGNGPNIIRKNRNSIAVLTGAESEERLRALGEDIFRYYGLGCRSVSKLFVPKDYNFDAFFKAIFPFGHLIDQHKYANNYDYNKAVYLMSRFNLLDNGFLMLKEDEQYASPIATLFYEYYDSLEELRVRLENDREKLQCIVSEGVFADEVHFGQTQKPSLASYADNRDTVQFLLKT